VPIAHFALLVFLTSNSSIFIMEFFHEMSSGIFGVLDPYVTSEFYKHSLTVTTTVVANIASAVVSISYAKLV
jgi:hypothetical protein